MSKTPRTEKHCVCGDDKARCVDCLFELSCQMEAELAEARAEIERKDKLIEQMREALRLALPEARSTHCENIIKAALAAERGE